MRKPACLRFALPSLVSLFCCSCGSHSGAARNRQVIVIGVDGMDPGFVERHWNELPNLNRLRHKGSFSRLATTMPPQSPVAWSTFITGLDPDETGIFDFVHRDPATLEPYLSTDRTEEPRLNIPLGPYLLPLEHSRVVSLMKGEAFWQILAGHDVPVTVMRIPANYPPVHAGNEIAGMGTPDLRGTLGTFSFYTDDPDEITRPVSGGVINRVSLRDGHVSLKIDGPADSLRKDRGVTQADLEVDVDPERPLARLTVGSDVAIVRQGEWSDWIAADFELIPHVANVRGMVRVYAKQLHPQFELYVSPVNADPAAPALPISAPASFSRALAEEIGPYFTLGIPEDTSALRQGVFDLDDFLSQSRLVLDDERRLFHYSLDHFNSGFLFFYFSSVDQNSHILWGKYEANLLDVYRAIDDCIGEAARRFPASELIVMSDHGFSSFERAVNLNTWLHENGYLALRGAGSDTNTRTLADIDWQHTKAYALGLNGLYLNMAGREAHGIVHEGAERNALVEALANQLCAFRDPENGRVVFETVTPTRPAASNWRVAPDMIAGYARGYRASWQTALGETPEDIIDENTDAWIADHCINPADVPGVLFTSQPMKSGRWSLKDLAPSILSLYGISKPAVMTGRTIF